MDKKMVKLYIYQLKGEQTLVDSFQREDFEDFIIVSGNFADTDPEGMQSLHERITESTDKTVLIVDNTADLSFYGIKETEQDSD